MGVAFLLIMFCIRFYFACLPVKVQVKVTLEQATKSQTGSRGIALLFL